MRNRPPLIQPRLIRPAAPPPSEPEPPAEEPTEEPRTPIVVIAAPNEQVARLLQRDLKVWIIPNGRTLDVHTVVADEATTENVVAGLLAALGCSTSEIEEQIPTIKLGWPAS